MKKLILFLLFVTFTIAGFSQKYLTKRATFYADAAAKEFKLSDEQKQQVLDTRMTYEKAVADLNKNAKEGTITKEEKAEKMKAVNTEFKASMLKATGVKGKDFAAFGERMKTEMKNVK